MSTLERGVILRALLFFATLIAWMLALVAGMRRRFAALVGFAFVALILDAAGRSWSRRSPIPMPYFMRWLLPLPRGPHSPAHLLRILRPRPGERVLEVGAGIGVHAIAVAAALGRLYVNDVQPEMLHRLMQHGSRNILPAVGDGQRLPYAAHVFDAVYLIGVLGEIPDADRALRELRRVLKPSGRLVIAEMIVDPDFIPLSRLRHLAGQNGFELQETRGPRCAYMARASLKTDDNRAAQR